MHVWPQVIGMFGWLIDKISLRSLRTDNLELLDSECRQKFEVTQVLLRFSLSLLSYHT